MTEVDVLILGAGAAGLFCAIHAGRRGRRTLVLEHADRPGKKILISGGGRCNFTNRDAGPANFLSANPHFAKSALARYTPQDFLALVEQHRIPWHEKTLGQLFCDRSAHDILNMLLNECAAANARIQLSTRALSVTPLGSSSRTPSERSESKAPPLSSRSAADASTPPLSSHSAAEGSTPPLSSRSAAEGSTPPLSSRSAAEASTPPLSSHSAAEGSTPPLSSRSAAEGSTPPLSSRSAAEGSASPLSSRSAAEGSASPLSSRSAAEGSASRFHIETSNGPVTAASLVIATGGLSIPKMGATSFGYDLARQFGLALVEPRPGLVPLVFSPEDQADWCDLAGISAEVIAATGAQPRSKSTPARSAREKMLITHRGLSGPAILQISSYWHPGESIQLDLAPDAPSPTADPVSLSILAPLTRPNARRDLAAVAQALRSIVPGRMADRWRALHARAHPADAQSRALSNTTLAQIERDLHHWRITPAGTEGYAKAEVTAGGVSTDELDARTMQCRRIPGLYFIGEVVDVTGWLGGYNFQWAWASGHAAGQSA